MAFVFSKQLVAHVLENPKYYPGPHNVSQPRTSQGLSQLDTTRQTLLIWDATCNYIRECLEQGRSVNVPNFGAFTFEPVLLDNAGFDQSFRATKETVQLRPCFCVNGALKETLYRYPGKEEIRTTPNAGSVYQSGGRVVFLNAKPIAAGCYYNQDVISSTIKALFQGVIDLVKREYNVQLDFNGSKIIIEKRNLHVKFSPSLTRSVQNTTQRRKSNPISNVWKHANLSASMMNFIERPSSPEVVAMRNRTAHLSILSLDMNSCASNMRKSRSTPML